ncbi:MAG: ROK family protein [Chitinophagaceae bacterium]|nr:ROK family protein [Chitinophagaceae bacterium]MCW5928012.1 ROK family protein [Chitinophagaceae bacterium]
MVGKHSVYRKKIVNHLYFSNALSCAELSDKIGKSLSLTTRMLNELVEEGLVEEKGYAPSSGGRRPLTYSLRPDIMYIISVAIDQFFTRIAIMDMHNNIIGKVETWDINLAAGSGTLQEITGRINETILASGIDKSRILGIGMSMPGFVDSRRSLNYSFLPVEPGFRSISEFVESKVGVPVFIDNDSSLVALAELRFGAAMKQRNVMVVNIGWGIGLGMVLNKELFRGNEGLAGEFSHIPLFQNGKICSCGKSGCLETEASLGAVVEKAKRGLMEGKTSVLDKEKLDTYLPDKAGTAIVSAANKGDRFAVELLSEAGYHIGRGIAILIHLLNPGQIVLSGRGAPAGRILQAPIQQALNEHCIPRLSANTEITISTLGGDAQLIGTAALVVEKYEKPIFNQKKTRETV